MLIWFGFKRMIHFVSAFCKSLHLCAWLVLHVYKISRCGICIKCSACTWKAHRRMRHCTRRHSSFIQRRPLQLMNCIAGGWIHAVPMLDILDVAFTRVTIQSKQTLIGPKRMTQIRRNCALHFAFACYWESRKCMLMVRRTGH